MVPYKPAAGVDPADALMATSGRGRAFPLRVQIAMAAVILAALAVLWLALWWLHG